MNMRTDPRRPRTIVAAVVAVVLLGLGAWLLSPWGSNAAAPELEGKTWQLTTINGQPPAPNSQASLKFEGGKISGNASVNGFGGSYRASGGKLTTSDLAITLMASVDPALNQQEAVFMGILQEEMTYTVSGNQLALTSPGGTLIFTA